MVTTTRELEMAWPMLMAGDVDGAIAQLLYVDHPCRMVRGIAESLKRYHPRRELAWLRTSNTRLGGAAPAAVLRIDDDGTWREVARALLPNHAQVKGLEGAYD